MPSGTMRSGWGLCHSSKNQSFHARVTASPSSGSEHRENTDPQNPVICDGKFTDAQMPLRSMSRMRAPISKQPGRISSKRVGSMSQSSRARPTTALMPTWKKILPVELPHLVTLDGLDDAGGQRLEPRGEPTVEHPGRLDEVVVDRDQRVEHRTRLGVGQQPVQLALAPVQRPRRSAHAHGSRVA